MNDKARARRLVFAECGTPLGFYPVVDNIVLLRTVLDVGATVVQLRIKNTEPPVLTDLIGEAVVASREYRARLFVNDHWRLALKLGAYGVHLGQEDLTEADLAQIHQGGLRLGLSTHSAAELATALKVWPSYVALGPIFPTQTKIMPWTPQGLENLRAWRVELHREKKDGEHRMPLVAIGGITLERAQTLTHLADGIAVVSDIRDASSPRARAAAWAKLFS